MKTLTFIAITLFSGAIAGTFLGLVNQGIVEPYIDQAIQLEMQGAINSGEMINPTQFDAYRLWQKGGEIAAGTILGLSIGALFGLVFAYGRGALPGTNDKKKALVLAGIMWAVLFLIPALKYPANPPAVGDPETIYYRQSLYMAFIVISGTSALGLAFLHKRVKSKAMAPAIYAGIMIAAFVAMPPNPDAISAPMDLVTSFRIVSALTMSVFWGVLGITLGAFWDRLKPHETAKIKAL